MTRPPEVVQRILREALKLKPVERSACLDRACGDDAELRTEVELLLADHDGPTATTVTEPSHADAVGTEGTGPPRERGGIVPDFSLIRPIGSGGFGTVWVARNEHTREYKAVKVVPTTGERASRAAAEMRGIVEYKRRVEGYPGFIPIDHVGRVEDAYYHVMPLADGATGTAEVRDPFDYEPLSLRLFLERKGRLPAREALDIVATMLRALGHLHEQGATHYDVKPDNVLRYQGRWCLGDHGLMTAQREEPAGSTPSYTPPEGPGERTSDLYAVGKILFELMTGEEVDRFDDRVDVLPSLPREDPDWVRAAAIMRLACHPDPDRRYRTADDFLTAVVGASGTAKGEGPREAASDEPADPVLPGVLARPVGESKTERAVKQIVPWVASIQIHAGLIALGFLVTWSTVHFNDGHEPLLVTAEFDALSYEPTVSLDSESAAVEDDPRAGNLTAVALAESLAEQRDDPDRPPLSLQFDREAPMSRSDFAADPRQDTVTFLGLTTDATKIVYVIDASGSMIPTFQIIIAALARSLGHLSPSQQYAVVFFPEAAAATVLPHGMTPATGEAKVRTLAGIDGHVVPEGPSDPRTAIELALGFEPDVIFLLSENITGSGRFEIDQAALLQKLDELNPIIDEATGKRRTRINCIQFRDTDPINTLRAIASRHGEPGGFRILDRAELGLR